MRERRETISLIKWLLVVDNKTEDIKLCDCLSCENYMEACQHMDPLVMRYLLR